MNTRDFTRLPRLVGLSPWSAHALAPAVWISGPLNSLDPLILNPLSWGKLPRKGGNIQGEVFQGPGVHLEAPCGWPFGSTQLGQSFSASRLLEQRADQVHVEENHSNCYRGIQSLNYPSVGGCTVVCLGPRPRSPAPPRHIPRASRT